MLPLPKYIDTGKLWKVNRSEAKEEHYLSPHKVGEVMSTIRRRAIEATLYPPCAHREAKAIITGKLKECDKGKGGKVKLWVTFTQSLFEDNLTMFILSIYLTSLG